MGDLRAAVVTEDHTSVSSNKHKVCPCTFSHPWLHWFYELSPVCVLRLHNRKRAFVPIAIRDQVVRAAAMFTWIKDVLLSTSSSPLPLTRDPRRALQEHAAALSAFLTASHLLLCNGICFVYKGLGVSWKALIPNSPTQAGAVCKAAWLPVSRSAGQEVGL